MAIKTLQGTTNVLDAAKQRILNVFSNGCKVYLSFSAGKDSLVMSHLVYSFILQGKINPKQLTVVFIDEEAYYRSMYEMAMRWRNRFTKVGAEFKWYCLPFKQVSAFEHLADEESWITFEPGKEDCWVHQPPPFAITRHPALHYAGEMNYQTFCDITMRDGINLVGVRASESVQRIKYLATMDMANKELAGNNCIYPIYDWSDKDVWLYIKENNLDFPEAYINLYRSGVKKHQLRLSNLFGADSCNGLRYVSQTDPDLWAQIQKREPNAYLVLLYWDSEMFKRSTKARKELEADQEQKDYKELITEMLFRNPDKFFTNASTKKVAKQYKLFIMKRHYMLSDKTYKRMYEALVAGDPKLRTLRALYTEAYVDYLNKDKQRS